VPSQWSISVALKSVAEVMSVLESYKMMSTQCYPVCMVPHRGK